MPTYLTEQELEDIVSIVARYPKGVSATEIRGELNQNIPLRTLQYRLRRLVEMGRLIKRGQRRGTKYLPLTEIKELKGIEKAEARLILPSDLELTPASREIRKYVRQQPASRSPVGYKREFLDEYKPNETTYLSEVERRHLASVGNDSAADQPAGTYAKQILNRLLIDLSWNSSRLEGNTYSLLDTKRLIDFGQEAKGKDQFEAQMLLNHKDAIEFIVESAEEIGFNRYTIQNLHGILANNLLEDPNATGRIRQRAVGIGASVFHPLELPQLIGECFDKLLLTADGIKDPFEQALFVLAQLPYLQPFEDVNKRVSRLAANIPFVKLNLVPLSFIDVPADLYVEAMLGVYEMNRIALLKEVFIWAYERSADRYAAVRQSLGDPDPFRLKNRENLRTIISSIVKERLARPEALVHIAQWAEENVDEKERDKFREVAEAEILGLHAGNFARYRLRPSEFEEWEGIWGGS